MEFSVKKFELLEELQTLCRPAPWRCEIPIKATVTRNIFPNPLSMEGCPFQPPVFPDCVSSRQ
jgi:hypothetical protein